MKKYAAIILYFVLVLFGCGGTTYNITGDNNTVGNDKTINGVNVETPVDVDVNANTSQGENKNKEEQISKDASYIDKTIETEETGDSSGITTENDTEGSCNSDISVTPFVTSTPETDGVTCVDLVNWSDSDRDIFNNNYLGSNTMKLTVYNLINVIGGGSDNITAEIHLPLGERFNEIWTINFVVMQDMVGNGSYANVTLFSGDEELYPTFTIESDTTDEIMYEVNLEGIRDLVIRFDCHAVGSGFCAGVIIDNK